MLVPGGSTAANLLEPLQCRENNVSTFSRQITCGPDMAEFSTALGSTAASDHPINLWIDLHQQKGVRVDNHLNKGAFFLSFRGFLFI